MPRWGMVIDLDKCSGCQACVVACHAENNIAIIGPEEAAKGRTIHWIELIPYIEGEYPHIKARLLPRPCMHCDHPPCTKVCPVNATYINEEGLVAQINHRCIGCRYCTTACPYTVKYFNWYEPQWPKEMKGSLNRDVSLRTKGVVEKCNFCEERLAVGLLPACVEACRERMAFGDLTDPGSEVRKLLEANFTIRRKPHLGTQPQVYYIV